MAKRKNPPPPHRAADGTVSFGVYVPTDSGYLEEFHEDAGIALGRAAAASWLAGTSVPVHAYVMEGGQWKEAVDFTVQTKGPKLSNPVSARMKAALGAFGGALIGGILTGGTIGRWLGLIVGGALGGYQFAAKKVKKGAAIGGALGGAFGSIGAGIGGYIGSYDKESNPRKRKQKLMR